MLCLVVISITIDFRKKVFILLYPLLVVHLGWV